MSNRYTALFLLALLLAIAHTQEAAHTQNNSTQVTPEAPKVDTPPPELAAPTQEAHTTDKAAATATTNDEYMAKIKALRNQVKNNKDLDHGYLEKKINQVIASMSPQQLEIFESNLSSESRVAYENYKKEQQRKIQKQQEQDRKLEAAAAQLSQSEQTLKQEIEEMQNLKKYQERVGKVSFNDYQFELDSTASSDFEFTLPVDQQVGFIIRVFSDDNGVFGSVKDIVGEQPIRVYIYQNRDRIVADASFYSMKHIVFLGKANTTYLVRFSNHGNKRLIAFLMNHILLEAHVGSKLIVEDVADHGRRVSEFRNQLKEKLKEQTSRQMMENENEKSLTTAFGHYYFYNIGQIVLLGIICVIQVESIRKLLIASSVV